MSQKEVSLYKFKSGVRIGDLDAETDDFLIDAFIERYEVDILLNFNDKRFILSGRTGSGKTAVLKYLEYYQISNQIKVYRIKPEELSLKYLSDSVMLNYFKALNIKMDLFYKSLWEHIIIVELIKIHTERDPAKVDNFFDRIRQSVSNAGRIRREDFQKFKNYQEDFWKKTEERVKTIEENVSNKLQEKIGVDMKVLNKTLNVSANAEEELARSHKITKEQLYVESKQIVSDTKLEEIKEIKDLLRKDTYSSIKKGKYILVIDDLDKEWVDKRISYELIKSLIDVIKGLRFENVKIIIAARDNLVDMVLDTVKRVGDQREKYRDLILPLSWNDSQLRALVNKRLAELMKEKYTNNSPTIDQILRSSGTKPWPGGFLYILHRTFLRPRDIIDYINLSIQASQGQTIISKKIIQEVEKRYSSNRLEALEDEWRENYGNLKYLYKCLKSLKDGTGVFTLFQDIKDIFEAGIGYIYDDDKCNYQLKQMIEEYINSSKDNKEAKLLNLFNKSLSILHQIGLVGLKNVEEKTDYYSETKRLFDVEELSEDTKIYVHPMFHKTLLINTSSRNKS